MRIIRVYFGSRLPREQFYDDTKRDETLRLGLERIKEYMDGIETLRSFNSACAVALRGADGDIEQLQAFLDSQDIAWAEDDPQNPPFRAAS